MRRRSYYYYIMKRFIKDAFTKNLTLKITALVATIALWFMITTSHKVEMVKKLPLNFITSADLVVSGDATKDVEVRFTGPRAFLQEVMQKSYVMNIDLRDRKIGHVSYRLYPDLLKLPVGIKITGFYPSEVATRLERLKTKTVNVIPSFTGEVPYGYKLKSFNIEPKTVDITGAESLVLRTDEAFTDVIDLSQISQPMTRNIGVDPKYKEKFKSVSAENFSILLDIVPYMASKTFSGVALRVVGSKSYTLIQNKVNVALEGPKVLIDKLTAQDIRASVDLSFNAPGEYEEEVVVKLPDGIRLVSTSPKKVKVEIKGE
jgi:YbbR domain-containing protein